MIHCFLNFLFGANERGVIDRTALWTAVAAVAAIVAVLGAWYELGKSAEATRADFAKRFVDSFFTGETRTFFALLMNSALEFRVLKIENKEGRQIDNLPFLHIKQDIAHQLKGIVDIPLGKTGYSAFEIDDLLLGHLEDVGWYEKRKLIDMETVREMFGYHIFECFENQEIQKYLGHACNDGKFDNFKRLATIIKQEPK